MEEIITIPGITVIVYLLMAIYKETIAKDKVNLNKIIPSIAGFLGIILGIVAFYLAPGALPAGNIFTAIFIGLSSGLAATGANQIYKQMVKKD